MSYKLLAISLLAVTLSPFRALPMEGESGEEPKALNPDRTCEISLTAAQEAAINSNSSTELDDDVTAKGAVLGSSSSEFPPVEEKMPPPTQEEEPPIVQQFRALVPSFGFNAGEASNLHACLKNLQKRQEPTRYEEGSFLWNNEAQRFEIREEEPEGGEKKGAELGDGSLDDAIQILNDYVLYERQERRADHYSLKQQDQHEPQLLDELRAPTRNLQRLSLQVAYSDTEGSFSSDPLGTAEAVHSRASIHHPNEQPVSVLLFGFNLPGTGPRLAMKNILQDKTKFDHVVIHDMRHYNQSLGWDAGIKVDRYLHFIREAKKQGLANLVTEERMQKLEKQSQDGFSITLEQAQAWATFLSRPDNLSRFDFSKKLQDSESRKRFFAKNYNHIPANQGISDILSQAIKSSNWDQVIELVKPALDWLEYIGISLIQKRESYDQKKFATYANQKEIQSVLTSILRSAFFRATSKLGLEFAREQNMKVAFVWDHYFGNHSASANPVLTNPRATLKELRGYFEQKPYYHLGFRTVPAGRVGELSKYPEAITCSEIRHLGRLVQRSSSNQAPKPLAPDYLLLRSINTSLQTEIPPVTQSEEKSCFY